MLLLPAPFLLLQLIAPHFSFGGPPSVTRFMWFRQGLRGRLRDLRLANQSIVSLRPTHWFRMHKGIKPGQWASVLEAWLEPLGRKNLTSSQLY